MRFLQCRATPPGHHGHNSRPGSPGATVVTWLDTQEAPERTPSSFFGVFPMENLEATGETGMVRWSWFLGQVNGQGQTLMRQIVGGTGGHSQSSLAVHFGLGPTEMVDTVEVLRPSGLHTRWANQPAKHADRGGRGRRLSRRRSGRLHRRGQRVVGLASIELGATSIRWPGGFEPRTCWTTGETIDGNADSRYGRRRVA